MHFNFHLGNSDASISNNNNNNIIIIIKALAAGMTMQDYGLGLRVGLKDLPTLRTRIHIKF